MVDAIVEKLRSLGLSDNESKVYLAMLELGPSPVMEIARKAEINRPTAYAQIETLKKKGLVSTQTKGKKQLYIAESPEHLEFVIDRQLSEIKNKKDEFQNILPELLNLYATSGSRPQVRFFEGKEGILRMQEIVLKSNTDEILAVASLDQIFNLFPSHVNNYSNKRVDKGIRSRLIYTYSKGPTLKDNDEKMLRTSKFVSEEMMPLSGDLSIYGDSVAISALTGKISGIIIDHPEIAKSFKSFFELIWNSIK